MNRCQVCVMPDTRPDTPFTDWVCQACLNYANRPTIDWEARKAMLVDLLDRHHGECIVPSSGGKDSTAQVLKLQAMGAHVTVVTARTCHLTKIGRENIDNLARYARTIEYTPNMKDRAKLNRLGMEMVGDISWPEHVSIFTTPFRAAHDLNIPLIFYGENPQDQYGGPKGTEEALTMTRRWVSEFGGFLGLRPADMANMLSERAMRDYVVPKYPPDFNPEAHFLGQYLPWDSHENAAIAMAAGMRTYPGGPPTRANWWIHENLDNAQTGIHDCMMWRKYGYGRGCAQMSVDVRTGRAPRKQAMDWVQRWDGHFPDNYAGVSIGEVLDRIEMTPERFRKIVDQFTNWQLFRRVEDNAMAEPILIV